jgi:hypothetical protein
MENIYLEWQRLRRMERALTEAKRVIWPVRGNRWNSENEDIEAHCAALAAAFAEVLVPFKKEPEGEVNAS